jgi:hypothetical protein
VKGTKARRREGTKARRREGAKARRHEGTKARRRESAKAKYWRIIFKFNFMIKKNFNFEDLERRYAIECNGL